MIVYCTTINSTIQYANDNIANLLKRGRGPGAWPPSLVPPLVPLVHAHY